MRFSTLALLAICCTIAMGAEFTVGSVTIQEPWARPTPPGAVTGAGYLRLSNSGNGPDRLISANSEVAERIELHTHLMDGEVMRMRQMESVELPVGEQVAFSPGGMHLMLIGLRSPLLPGQSFPLTLTFERAGEITVTVTVGHAGSD